MSNTYKFLGTISAVYNFADADENYYITLAVFYNAENLKIHYDSLEIKYSSKEHKSGKIILKDTSIAYFTSTFNEKDTKKMILRDFLRNMDIWYYNFEIVY